MKKVKYRVTGAFGLSDRGEIREAILIYADVGGTLLYHPRGEDCCASLEMCKLTKDGYYESSSGERGHGYDCYVNIESQRDLNRIINNLSKISYKNTKECVIKKVN